MADAKFEPGSFSILGDMTLKKFPSEEGERVVEFGYLPPENEFNFQKKFFESRIVLLDPKLTSLVNFSNFHAEENFVIFEIF